MTFLRAALRPISLVFVAPLLGGCMVGPDYVPPTPDMPAAFSQAVPVATEPAAAGLDQWWTLFNDPKLDELVDRAMVANLDLKLAVERVIEARTARTVSKAALLPTVDADASYSRNRDSLAMLRPGQGPLEGAERDYNIYNTGLSAAYELDLFGRVRRAVEASEADIESREEDRRAVMVSVLGDVARNYIEVRSLERQIAVTAANLRSQQDTLKLTRTRADAGVGTTLDVERARAQTALTASQLPPLYASLRRALHALDVLLHEHPGTLSTELLNPALQTTDSLEAVADSIEAIPPVPIAPLIPLGLPSDLLRRRPDIRFAERELAEATARIGVARGDLYPRVRLFGSFDLEASQFDKWLDGHARQWSFGPSVSYPVFDGGVIRANIDATDSRQRQAAIRYEQAIQTALRDVEDASTDYLSAWKRREALAEAVDANTQAVSLARDLFRTGLGDFLSVLDAERDLLNAQVDLVASEGALSSATVAIYRALGGGWEMGEVSAESAESAEGAEVQIDPAE